MERDDSECLKYIFSMSNKKLWMLLKIFQRSDSKYEKKFGKWGPYKHFLVSVPGDCPLFVGNSLLTEFFWLITVAGGVAPSGWTSLCLHLCTSPGTGKSSETGHFGSSPGTLTTRDSLHNVVDRQ